MNKAWEDFAAFSEICEIEHECDRLRGLAATDPAIRDPAEWLTGEKSYLYERLSIQYLATEEILEKERPGLFQKIHLRDDMGELFVILDEVTEKPYRLAEELPDIRILLLKTLIAAHEVFDPRHRAALVAKAEENGRSIGIAAQRAAQSKQAKDAVSRRGDQVRKAAFMAWAKDAVAAGTTASNIEELQALPGFVPEWSQTYIPTLRGWAKEAGFAFKTGRPSKKK